MFGTKALVVILASAAWSFQEGPAEYARGLSLFRSGQFAEAERAFLEVLASQQAHAPSSVYLARIYAQSARHEDAEAVLHDALDARPNGIRLLNELGSVYLETRRYADAEAIFARAVEIRRDNMRAVGGLAESRMAMGRHDQAMASVERAMAERPRVGTLRLIGASVELRRERYSRALELVDEAERLGTSGANSRVVRALALEGAGRLEEALVEIEAARLGYPADATIARTHGLVLMALNRDSRAEAVLMAVVERDPSDATAWIALGRLYFRRSQSGRARVALERALAIEPDHEEAHFYMGEIALMEIQFEEAVTHYQHVTTHEGRFVDARQKLAEALLKLGRYEEAETFLEEALAISSEDAQTHYLLGQVHRDSGDRPAALVALEEARRIRPNHAPSRYLLGVTLAQLDRKEEADEELRAFRELKAFEEQAEALEYALIERPDDIASFRALIELYFAHGRERNALAFLEKAVALSDGDADLLYRLAIARLRAGRIPDAHEAARRARALEPDHPLRPEVDGALEGASNEVRER